MRPVMPSPNRRGQIVPRHDVGATLMITPVAARFGLFAPAFTMIPWIRRAPPEVPATVTDDPSLPWLEGEAVMLQGRVADPKYAPLVVVPHGRPKGMVRSWPDGPYAWLSRSDLLTLLDTWRGRASRPRLCRMEVI